MSRRINKDRQECCYTQPHAESTVISTKTVKWKRTSAQVKATRKRETTVLWLDLRLLHMRKFHAWYCKSIHVHVSHAFWLLSPHHLFLSSLAGLSFSGQISFPCSLLLVWFCVLQSPTRAIRMTMNLELLIESYMLTSECTTVSYSSPVHESVWLLKT